MTHATSRQLSGDMQQCIQECLNCHPAYIDLHFGSTYDTVALALPATIRSISSCTVLQAHLQD
jgi:hypothetical protein